MLIIIRILTNNKERSIIKAVKFVAYGLLNTNRSKRDLDPLYRVFMCLISSAKRQRRRRISAKRNIIPNQSITPTVMIICSTIELKFLKVRN